MNKKILLFTATLGIAYLGLTSYKNGPATNSNANLTGAAGSAASCGGAGCHAASSTKSTGILSLRVKSSGLLVTNGKYVAGTVYIVTLNGTNTSLLTKFGFQVAATNAANTNGGTLTATAASTVKKTIPSGLSIIEHTAALAGGTLPGTFMTTFEWTAPAAGSGAITFYGIINAVNGTGTTAGDEPSNGFTLVLNEFNTSISEKSSNIASKIYPNPCNNVLNIEAVTSAKFMATVYDLAGRQLIAPSYQNNIDVSALSAGVYLLKMNTEDGQQTATFVKQ